jgi:hypothetical protein
MKRLSLVIFALALVIGILSCHHKADLTYEPPKPVPPGPGFQCSPDTVYFGNAVLPLIVNGCAKSGCHDAATHKAGHVLDSYTNIMKLVDPFNPQGSTLYTILFSNSEERMPPGTPFTENQKSIVYWWIKQGAYNNKCDSSGCDSTNVTFTRSINPIIQSWCIGCHSGSNPSGGISLETYADVVACANSNRLMGALRHETGYSAMPKGGQLTPCEIALFQKWIDLGKPQKK